MNINEMVISAIIATTINLIGERIFSRKSDEKFNINRYCINYAAKVNAQQKSSQDIALKDSLNNNSGNVTITNINKQTKNTYINKTTYVNKNMTPKQSSSNEDALFSLFIVAAIIALIAFSYIYVKKFYNFDFIYIGAITLLVLIHRILSYSIPTSESDFCLYQSRYSVYMSVLFFISLLLILNPWTNDYYSSLYQIVYNSINTFSDVLNSINILPNNTWFFIGTTFSVLVGILTPIALIAFDLSSYILALIKGKTSSRSLFLCRMKPSNFSILVIIIILFSYIIPTYVVSLISVN